VLSLISTAISTSPLREGWHVDILFLYTRHRRNLRRPVLDTRSRVWKWDVVCVNFWYALGAKSGLQQSNELNTISAKEGDLPCLSDDL